MMGRQPEPDDLIVPLPPAAVARRRSRKGEAFRGHDYIGKRWREHIMPILVAEGWRYREPYAMKATFITLAIEDGANRDIIRDRVTHSKPRRDAFDGYDRGSYWEETCREILKLKVGRREAVAIAASGGGGKNGVSDGSELSPLSAVSVQSRATSQDHNENSGGGGSRTGREPHARGLHSKGSVEQGHGPCGIPRIARARLERRPRRDDGRRGQGYPQSVP
jgi:hypothetical protein